ACERASQDVPLEDVCPVEGRGRILSVVSERLFEPRRFLLVDCLNPRDSFARGNGRWARQPLAVVPFQEVKAFESRLSTKPAGADNVLRREPSRHIGVAQGKPAN